MKLFRKQQCDHDWQADRAGYGYQCKYCGFSPSDGRKRTKEEIEAAEEEKVALLSGVLTLSFAIGLLILMCLILRSCMSAT